MKIIDTIRKWVKRMLPEKSIEQVYHKDTALSDEMQARIDLWERMYAGTAPWTNEGIRSLRLEQGVVREFANITLNEMDVKISHAPLEKLYRKAVRDLNKHLQAGLASGAMIIKPLSTGKVQYLTQSGFRVLSYDTEGAPVDVVFPDVKKLGDNDYRIRLERHTLDPSGGGLTITNRSFSSSAPDTLGREIPLTSVEEWAGLPAVQQFPMMQQHAFGYYVNPIDNTVDGGHGGVSVYEAACHIIRMADTQFGRLDWEFESAERRIDADMQAVKVDADGNAAIPAKIYRSVDVEDLFQEFSPVLRHEGFIKGLDEYKRSIEFIVGLSYGDLSNPQSVEKTAAEIMAAKQRKYNTVTAIQEKLKACLEELVYAIAFYQEMTHSGYTFACTIHDSILTDSAEERKQDMQDVSMGVMQLWEYRMKHYGEDEATAKRMVAGSEPDLLGDEVSLSAGKADTQPQTEVQGKSLNGAQTQSLIAIMAQFSAGELTEGQAVNLIATAIGITKEEARKILNGDVT